MEEREWGGGRDGGGGVRRFGICSRKRYSIGVRTK